MRRINTTPREDGFRKGSYEEGGARFKAAFKPNYLVLPVILLLVLTISVAFFLALMERHRFLAVGVYGVIVAMLLLSFLPVHSYYEIGEVSLRLRRITMKKDIPLARIESVRVIGTEEGGKVLEGMENSINKKTYDELDFAGSFSEQTSLGNMTKYCTVPITFSTSGNSTFRRIAKVKVKIESDLVLVELKDGMKYLISPERKEEFVDLLAMKLPPKEPLPSP